MAFKVKFLSKRKKDFCIITQKKPLQTGGWLFRVAFGNYVINLEERIFHTPLF